MHSQRSPERLYESYIFHDQISRELLGARDVRALKNWVWKISTYCEIARIDLQLLTLQTSQQISRICYETWSFPCIKKWMRLNLHENMAEMLKLRQYHFFSQSFYNFQNCWSCFVQIVFGALMWYLSSFWIQGAIKHKCLSNSQVLALTPSVLESLGGSSFMFFRICSPWKTFCTRIVFSRKSEQLTV